MRYNQKFLTHPDTQETYNLSEWASKIGVSISTLTYRLNTYSENPDKVFSTSKIIRKDLWTQEEDDFLLSRLFELDACIQYQFKSKNSRWKKRSDDAVKFRINKLQHEVKLRQRRLTPLGVID